MPRVAAKLPPEVLAAKRAYLAVKRAFGICHVMSCTRPVREGRKTCERCGARMAANTARYEAGLTDEEYAAYVARKKTG